MEQDHQKRGSLGFVFAIEPDVMFVDLLSDDMIEGGDNLSILFN